MSLKMCGQEYLTKQKGLGTLKIYYIFNNILHYSDVWKMKMIQKLKNLTEIHNTQTMRVFLVGLQITVQRNRHGLRLNISNL